MQNWKSTMDKKTTTALIGVVLSLVTPKINQSKDKAIIEQSINSLNYLDAKINEVLEKGQGNVRKIDSFTMKKGELFIDSSNDSIYLILDDLTKPYSEPGIEIEFGKIKIVSEQKQKKSSVKLKLNYNGIMNITYDNAEGMKKFSAGSVPYSFIFENKGNVNGTIVVNLREVSR